jgi:PAS domain-containing protein
VSRRDAAYAEKSTRRHPQAEKELQKSERDKDLILNAISELVVYQDRDHRIIWANKAAAESVGQSVGSWQDGTAMRSGIKGIRLVRTVRWRPP